MKITDLKAKDIMKSNVVKVCGSMTLAELASLFEMEHITGAPVVEGGEKLIGVVSETDLVRDSATHQAEDREKRAVSPYFKDPGDGMGDVEDISESEETARQDDTRTVEDIMTPWTISVSEDAPVTEVAKTMVHNRIHRVLVTDRKFHLKGIITTMDIARVVADLAVAKAA
ncbi:MAG: CBS domain-containing protein [Candidatus Omnitrophica bacterium]|nr:CBS domain-containing protein [Candidatus Omnitrophota bacterium]